MKIAIVCYPTFGGSGVLATELGISLHEHGHEVHFIAYKKPVRLTNLNNNLFFHKVNVPDYPLFNFQPYVAIKWQFLDRMGLRMSAGFNRGTIGAGRWRLNGHIPINDSPEASIGGFTVRTVIYFGL